MRSTYCAIGLIMGKGKVSESRQVIDWLSGPPLGEELLVEMPQYTTGRPPKPMVIPEER